MRWKTLMLLAITALAGFPLHAKAAAITLGTAGNFAVLAGSTVTNTGSSVIDGGDVGVSPGSAITGFPPGIMTPPFTTHAADAAAAQAQSDLTTAYNAAAGLTPTQDLTGQDLGGLTLTPGVYFFSSSAQLTGTLTLNDQGDPNAQFVFQIGSTLTTASNSSVVTINGGLDARVHRVLAGWEFRDARDRHCVRRTYSRAHEHHPDHRRNHPGRQRLGSNGAVTLDTNSITNCVARFQNPQP